MTSFDFTIFCLTVIALVAIAHRKDEIAMKSLAIVAKVISTLGDTTERFKRHFKKTRGSKDGKNLPRDQEGVPEAQDLSPVNHRGKRRA